MIPLQLRIKNFLSYGPTVQTIDFEPHRLICLSGKNGHGKSALLDALTWALWGQARKVSGTVKADEHLLRLGQSQMVVALDFLYAGHRYRVSREFMLLPGKKPHTELHFGLFNEATNSFSSLNEKTARGTQEKIISILGLDYDACINSIFLRQGQSNEFSKRSPQERKEVLAAILGLHRYEELRARALEKIRDLGKEREQRLMLSETIKNELKRQDELKARCTALAAELEKSSQTQAANQTELTQQEQLLQTIRNQLAECAALTQTRLAQQTQLAKITQQMATYVQEWTTIRSSLRSLQKQSTISNLNTVTLDAEIAKLEQETTRHFEAKTKLLTLHTQAQAIKTEIQQTVEAEIQKTTTAHHQAVSILKLLQARGQEAEKRLLVLETTKKNNERDLAETSTKQSEINKKLAELALIKKRFERVKEFYDRFIARGTTLKKELDALATTQPLILPDAASCPWCDRPLDAKARTHLHEKRARSRIHLEHQLTRLRRIVANLKTQLAALTAQLQENDNLAAARGRMEQHQLLIADQNTKLQAEEQQLLAERTQRAQEELVLTAQSTEYEQKLGMLKNETSNRLLKHGLFQELETERIKLETFCAEHLPHTEKIEQLKKTRNELREFEQLAHNRQLLSSKKRECVATFRLLSHQRRELRSSLARLGAQLEQEKELRIQYAACEKTLITIQGQKEYCTQQKEKLLIEKGALEQQIQLLQKKALELGEQAQVLANIENRLEDYQHLATALGKNGIQALLIENTIPEIEHEANELLAKLTNNQSHLLIESIRDLKGGGTKETLDIKISDTMGIRPYELFSGGEAFRIDFALRIAISKLLARRAGTSLQTLIIDEGFGSQDEEGLQNIMEALYRIQEDFEKILIVSHLPAMKNQFPTHFVVQKGPTGSTVAVVGNG